ncbi:GNT-I family protein [Ancylostoma caninum]|uniref:Alpha-1,3-mannosyl-glycoprotein 2-beta-N-acetylglucosaminyltransferase n=1 Tax=Ancylostoma caninum TaxID=29170 RepID=A0A368GZS4_ANCCA|nr:GNT-I family protein [Ancylostoma caninum]
MPSTSVHHYDFEADNPPTMASPRKFFIAVCGIGMTVWLYFFLGLLKQENSPKMGHDEVQKLALVVNSLQEQIRQESEDILRLKATIRELTNARNPHQDRDPQPPPKPSPWPEPIPVVVFACSRAAAVSGIVKKLISLRPSKDLFPIIVSQDCDNIPVQRAVAEFRDQVVYIKHKSAQQDNVVVPKAHKKYAAYYYIARHYKLALNHVFNVLNHNTVILLEDDLDIATDFFEYFSATRYLLDRDPQLWCVSAWNDNGKSGVIDTSANSLLYRSDFFPGLGWMMTSKTWAELSPKWPTGFWDDWMREPENRQGRQCIRPEVSRTKMTIYGKKGASKGQFYEKHVAKVILNTVPVSFTTINLDYLLNPSYDREFDRLVYEKSQLVNIDDAAASLSEMNYDSKSLRVEYTGNIDFIVKADKLLVMHDFKAGVPRTAYKGVVTSFINGTRIFLVPDRKFVKDYDKTWVVPSKFGD